jgi:hypothetical protein
VLPFHRPSCEPVPQTFFDLRSTDTSFPPKGLDIFLHRAAKEIRYPWSFFVLDINALKSTCCHRLANLGHQKRAKGFPKIQSAESIFHI